MEKNELQWLGDTYVDRLKREKKEKEENQKNMMGLEIDNKQLQLLDLLNKEMENTKVKIPYCKKLFMEAVHINNGLDNVTKGKYKKYVCTFLFNRIFISFLFMVNVVLLDIFQSMMVSNYGKTMETLIQEQQEMSTTNVRYYLIVNCGK